MNENKYKIGFWNYTETGKRNENEVENWKYLGFNLAMSWEYDAERHDKADMMRLLDTCGKNGIKVIVCDHRVVFARCEKLGREEYVRGVKAAVADFGAHSAVYGFHIGDEPVFEQLPYVELACKTVKELAPHLVPYVNLLPVWDETDNLGKTPTDYCDVWGDSLQKCDTGIVSYDYYGQCCYFEKEKYRNMYFRNFTEYGRIANKTDSQLWTCLLCVGHGSLREPTQDDIRWQINTAAAHGLTGFMWFALYENKFDNGWYFRNNPINRFGEKTSIYYALAYENKTFMQEFAPILSRYDFVRAMHYNTQYGGFPAFSGTEGVKNVKIIVNEACPLIVSEFKNETGRAIVVVNNSQTKPVCVEIEFEREVNGEKTSRRWYAPGGMQIYELPTAK